MITEQDLDEAIAECQGRRNPDARTCMMLAAFLTIKRELYDASEQSRASGTYSAAAPPEPPATYPGGSRVGGYGVSDFLRAVSGMPEADAWGIMDELMDTVRAIAPRLYRGVMHQINAKREPG